MRMGFLLVCAAGCASKPALVVHAPADLEPGLQIAVADLAADLEHVAGRSVARQDLPAPACDSDSIRLVVLGFHEADARSGIDGADLREQGYRIVEERCDGGRRIVISGGGLASAQWAIYDLLSRLGVRYFHPEQTYYPDRLHWPAQPIDVDTYPAFQDRSLHVHRTHPVELSLPLATELDMQAYQRRWIDWNVKLRHTLVDGHDGLEDYAAQRGFRRQTGINLLSTQQGGHPILDPTESASEEQQIAAAIDAQLAGDKVTHRLTVSFNPSEFTEVDDVATVERLTFIADYVSAHYPATQVYAMNHGTAGNPTPNYGVRFFDLGQFAPPSLGANVHLLMFYGLDRSAPVYGNADFTHQRTWIEAQAANRRVIYYPESSWWLSFDLPVPLFLAPVTMEARSRDIEMLRPLLASEPDAATGVVAHHLFSSGQEWGYWLSDWCVAQMSWDVDIDYGDCLDTFTSVLREGAVVRRVLQEVIEHQSIDMRDPDLIRYLVGSDDDTELAFTAGVVFHPLPPQPASVLKWTPSAAATLAGVTLPALQAMAEDYHRWADEFAALIPRQNERQAPWLREVHDGLRVFALRAEHATVVYATSLALRDALAAADLDAVEQAHAGVDLARAITAEAENVIRAREADYRYPAELTIAGDELGSPGAIPNRTIYPYRVLSRTHRLFYWTRPDTQLAALFGEGLERVQVNARILTPAQPLDVGLLADDVASLRIDYGDGTAATTLAPHRYATQGWFTWTLEATLADGAILHSDEAAVVERRWLFEKGSLEVQVPPGAELVEGALPGLVLGLGDDGAAFLALGLLQEESDVPSKGTLQRRTRDGMASGPSDLTIPIAGGGDVTVYAATLSLDDAGILTIAGQMQPLEVAGLLAETGGFDAEGAVAFVAAVLGYGVDTLPESLAFVITASGTEF